MATATTTTTTSTTTTTISNNDGGKPLVKDLHEHIVCPLCRGYLIDATTLVECLHSFCRGCIVRRLGSGARACPVCGALTLPPLLPDLALQRLVYLAVPGLYRSELDRRRHFRLVNPQCQPPGPPLGALSLTLDDAVSLSLCEIVNDDREYAADIAEEESALALRSSKKKKRNQHHNYREDNGNDYNSSSCCNGARRLIRYLKCPAGVTVRHLVRLLALKRGWGDTDGKFTLKNIEMLYRNNVKSNDDNENVDDDDDYGCRNDGMHRLQLSWTLLDLACIFKWDKETPMKLFYRVVKRDEPIIRLQPAAISTCNLQGCGNSVVGGNSNGIENVQRPPTPPPSPKQSNPEVRNEPRLQSKPKPKSDSIDPEVDAGKKNDKTESVGPEKTSSSSSASSSSSSSSSSNSPVSNQPRINPETSPSPEVHAPVNNGVESHGAKIKKPRCEVTPVMRAPGFNGTSCTPAVIPTTVSGAGAVVVVDNNVSNNNRSSKVPRIEHHKRRKRRNKRLIAEITTTPREDLLKLKVRLTPCPPRITSGTGGTAKEKLLQMRAVRREKIKNSERSRTPPPPALPVPLPVPLSLPVPVPVPVPIPPVVIAVNNSPEMPLTPPPSASADNIKTMPIIIAGELTNDDDCVVIKSPMKSKEVVASSESQEETIEEIIDGIPDEVVRVAQNMNCPTGVAPATEDCKPPQESGTKKDRDFVEVAKRKKREKKRVPEVEIISFEDEEELELEEDEDEELDDEDEEEDDPEKLVPTKPKKDEEVLRRLGLVAISEASKTLQDKIRGSKKSSGSGSSGGIDFNRESLERQLRESKANRVRSLLAEKQMRDALKSIMSKSKSGKGGGNGTGPKKGPPPLAPLTPKPGFSHPPKSSHPVNHPKIQIGGTGATGKIEKPLDLSSGANNALDLSPATPSTGVGVNNPPVITSTTFSSPVKSRGKNGGAAAAAAQQTGGSKPTEEKKNQDLNLRTLSDAAVSLLGTNQAPSTTAGGGEVRVTNSSLLSNKVALRIPQPHNRLSGFGNGMKIKPNLAVRHIPNPQAFVASQYVRNQRTNFFNAQQQQPP